VAEETERTSKNLTRAQYVYDKTMAKKEHEDKYDLFRVGYLHGRGGNPSITSHVGLSKLGQP